MKSKLKMLLQGCKALETGGVPVDLTKRLELLKQDLDTITNGPDKEKGKEKGFIPCRDLSISVFSDTIENAYLISGKNKLSSWT